MFWFSKYFNGPMANFKMKPEDDNGGGGGGADKNEPDEKDKKIAELEAKLKEASTKKDPPKEDNKDLADQARKEREAAEAKAKDTATLGSAIKFNMQIRDWAKTNASLLPPTVTGILDASDKVNYGDEIKKANALRAGVLSEFFAVQANLDLLTDSQKQQVADWKNLTQDEKQSRVSQIYDSVFEPTFLSVKRQKKAEQVSKGLGDPSDSAEAHKQKMQAFSRKHHLKQESK